MENTVEPLVFSEDGEDYAKLCANVTVYWRGSAFERAAGIVHFYKRAMKELGKSVKFFETGTMSGAKKLKADTLDLVPFWFQKSKRRSDIYMLNLESGAHANEPSDRSFFVIADEEDEQPVGAAQVNLPVETMTADPDRFVGLVEDLVAKLDFESGHAGYALNWDPRGDQAIQAQEKMAYVGARFQGVDLFDIDVTLVSLRKSPPGSIKCVNWLTLLGARLAERVGSPQAVKKQLGKTSTVVPLEHGLLIRAGDAPTLGDRNRKADVAAYRSVGKLLAPYRFVDHRRIFGAPTGGGMDPTGQWLARFDE